MPKCSAMFGWKFKSSIKYFTTCSSPFRAAKWSSNCCYRLISGELAMHFMTTQWLFMLVRWREESRHPVPSHLHPSSSFQERISPWPSAHYLLPDVVECRWSHRQPLDLQQKTLANSWWHRDQYTHTHTHTYTHAHTLVFFLHLLFDNAISSCWLYISILNFEMFTLKFVINEPLN